MARCNNCKNLETKDNGFDAYSWCEKINDCPHEDIERDCEHYSPMTNADRIRSMTDDEWFMHKHDLNCPDGEYQIRFPGTPYVLSMRKEEKGGEENDAH